MNKVSDQVSLSRDDLALPRFLALILFTIAVIIGLPTAALAIGTLMVGDWRGLLVATTAGPVVWVVVWLGRTLWSGRSIPPWFISAFCVGVVAMPFVAAVATRNLLRALILLALVAPVLMAIYPTRRPSAKKPGVLKEFDDFA